MTKTQAKNIILDKLDEAAKTVAALVLIWLAVQVVNLFSPGDVSVEGILNGVVDAGHQAVDAVKSEVERELETAER